MAVMPFSVLLFFCGKKKVSLSSQRAMQWLPRIKLLQLREFFELRRAAFREGGASAFEKKALPKSFSLGAKTISTEHLWANALAIKKQTAATP